MSDFATDEIGGYTYAPHLLPVVLSAEILEAVFRTSSFDSHYCCRTVDLPADCFQEDPVGERHLQSLLPLLLLCRRRLSDLEPISANELGRRPKLSNRGEGLEAGVIRRNPLHQDQQGGWEGRGAGKEAL